MPSAWGDSWGVASGGSPPAVPVLTVVDNANGTGAVATVGGSTAGSTNTVYVQADGAAGWTLAGSRVGDGTVALALAKGYYWAVVLSTLGGQAVSSNVVRLPVTDAADSVHSRCADAIRAKLLTLSMPLLTAGVKKQWLPDENMTDFPCVVVHFNEAEILLGGTNARDDVGYPVNVVLCDRKLESHGHVDEWWLSYRQRMMRAVRNQKLAGVPEVYTVQVTPLPVASEDLPKFLYFVTGFVAVCVSREVRG